MSPQKWNPDSEEAMLLELFRQGGITKIEMIRRLYALQSPLYQEIISDWNLLASEIEQIHA
ncbi:MAG: hypothetical protein VKJ06_04530 [Vampirovibrionales bacterium]|nr:hypothetical protein [Vampirovibrionales bacterium]